MTLEGILLSVCLKSSGERCGKYTFQSYQIVTILKVFREEEESVEGKYVF